MLNNTTHDDTVKKIHIIFALGKSAVFQKLKIDSLFQISFNLFLVSAYNLIFFIENVSKAAFKLLFKNLFIYFID